MAYTVEFDPNNEIIISTVEGKLEHGVNTPVIDETMKLSKEKNCKEILFDFKMGKIHFNSTDRIVINKKIDKIGLDSSFNIAILIESMGFEWIFYQKLASLKKINAKFFTDANDAKDFLKGQKEK